MAAAAAERIWLFGSPHPASTTLSKQEWGLEVVARGGEARRERAAAWGGEACREEHAALHARGGAARRRGSRAAGPLLLPPLFLPLGWRPSSIADMTSSFLPFNRRPSRASHLLLLLRLLLLADGVLHI
uniref:Uncharacterized protein n=1 Tax=Oryza glumipatula TaxID=40148 RepID=A0A0E0BJV8_9ORYZ